jgi:hypothetical protein
MRKTLAAVLLALLATALAAPSARADVSWGSKTPKDTVQGDGHTIGAHAHFSGGDVRDWEVHVLAPPGAGYPSYGLLCLGQGEDNGDADIKCPWDTTAYPPPGGGIAVNGQYEIIVKAWEEGCLVGSCRQEPGDELKRSIVVSNPAVTPGNVHAGLEGGSHEPTVTWNRNPEPDIVKYVIEERFGAGGWVPAGERGSGDTSFRRAALADAGNYHFRVAALRADGRGGTLQSGWTEAPESVDFNAPPTEGPGGPPPAPAEGEPLPDSFDGSPTTTTAPRPGVRSETPRGTTISPNFSFPSGNFSAPSAIPGIPGSPAISRTAEPDPGFSQYLPYQPKSTSTTSQGGQLAAPRTRTLVQPPKKKDPVSLVAPLAAGLAIFVLAMQFTYVVRRRPAISEVDDFSDWLGV